MRDPDSNKGLFWLTVPLCVADTAGAEGNWSHFMQRQGTQFTFALVFVEVKTPADVVLTFKVVLPSSFEHL